MSARSTIRALVVELERERAFGANPARSRLWRHAPWELKRQFADGYIDAATFWDGLERWLRFGWDRAT